MRRHARTAPVVAVLAAAGLVLAACAEQGEPPAGQDDRAVSDTEPAPRSPEPAQRHAAADCAKTPRSGRVVRTGYGLDYSSGAVHVAVAPYSGRDPVCVEFAKSGPSDPQVPPDTLLFTFAGPDGEGAQVEFESVALTGGVLPPLGNGYVPKVGPLDHPITARVGASVDGTYYVADRCSLLLTTVTANGAGGRFDCPAAGVQGANPFAPSDDVDYDADDTVAPPPAAKLSGWFELKR